MMRIILYLVTNLAVGVVLTITLTILGFGGNNAVALAVFSVVVGLPQGLMGFASAALARLFRVDPPELPSPAPLDAVLPARAHDGSVLLKLEELG